MFASLRGAQNHIQHKLNQKNYIYIYISHDSYHLFQMYVAYKQ